MATHAGQKGENRRASRSCDNPNAEPCHSARRMKDTFTIRICANQVSNDLRCGYAGPMKRVQADFVIVGAGAAGCLLANRLSADPSCKVILLEAGARDWNPLIRVPMLAGLLYYLPALN